MPDGSALLRELPSSSRLSARFGGGTGLIDREAVAESLRDRGELTKFRKLVAEERYEQAEMAALIGQSAPDDLDADWLTSRAERLREKANEFAETLRPVIGLLRSLLSPGRMLEPETERLVRDSVQILDAYPTLYRALSNWLMKQAAQRRVTSTEVLRARPVKSTTDHAALTREIIARYPKILAALAK